MDRIWYIIKKTEHIGPYSLDDLAQFFEEEKISDETAVWRSGMIAPVAYHIACGKPKGFKPVRSSSSHVGKIVEDFEYGDDVDEDEIFDVLNSEKKEELEKESSSGSKELDFDITNTKSLELEDQSSGVKTMTLPTSKSNYSDIAEEFPKEDIEDTPPPIPPIPTVVEKLAPKPEGGPESKPETKPEEKPEEEPEKEPEQSQNEFVQINNSTDDEEYEDYEESQSSDDFDEVINLDDLAEESLSFGQENEVERERSFPFFKIAIVLLFLGVTAKFGYEIYYIYFSKYSRPVGMMTKDYNRMTRLLSIKDPEKSAAISFSKDFSTIWTSINFPFEGRVYLELEAVKDKVLTSDEVKLTSSAKLNDKLAQFKSFNFEKGLRLYPGFYNVKFKLLNKKKLNFWIERFIDLPVTFDIREQVYIGKVSQSQFEVDLENFLKKRDNQNTQYWQDLFQRYDTLRLISSQIFSDFSNIINKLSKNYAISELEQFEKNYKLKYGQFLTGFVLENDLRFKKLNQSNITNKQVLIAYQSKLSQMAKQVAQTAMDALIKLSSVNQATNTAQVVLEVKNSTMKKLVEIENQCKKSTQLIRSQY